MWKIFLTHCTSCRSSATNEVHVVCSRFRAPIISSHLKKKDNLLEMLFCHCPVTVPFSSSFPLPKCVTIAEFSGYNLSGDLSPQTFSTENFLYSLTCFLGNSVISLYSLRDLLTSSLREGLFLWMNRMREQYFQSPAPCCLALSRQSVNCLSMVLNACCCVAPNPPPPLCRKQIQKRADEFVQAEDSEFIRGGSQIGVCPGSSATVGLVNGSIFSLKKPFVKQAFCLCLDGPALCA